MSTKFGFYFYPAADPHCHGHPKLAFNVYREPTEQHFDPVRALVHGRNPHGGISQFHIAYPWRGEAEIAVCFGRIVLQDRKHKQVEAFSFGGTLAVTTDDSETACVLTSPAPIFDLVNPDDTLTKIISGVEVAVAQQRAHWQHDAEFNDFLAQVSPVALYVAGLQAVADELAAIEAVYRGEEIGQQVHMVHQMMTAAREAGLWPVGVKPDVAALLDPKQIAD